MISNFIMISKNYNKTNFHSHTFCVFTEVAIAEIQNRAVNYKSKSGSSYYFTEIGVYRLSNHWGRVANCKWRLESVNSTSNSKTRLGFALWTSFHNDNDYEKLYFITVNFDKKTTNYHHKNSIEYSEKVLYRTSTEVTKTIKIIRNLFANDSWAKHFEYQDIDELRKTIIKNLITTNKSLQEIKKELRG